MGTETGRLYWVNSELEDLLEGEGPGYDPRQIQRGWVAPSEATRVQNEAGRQRYLDKYGGQSVPVGRQAIKGLVEVESASVLPAMEQAA